MPYPRRTLTISQKLLLSILSFSLPIVMLLYFTVSGINDTINFAQLELFGDRMLRPLGHLLVLVPEHERLAELVQAGDRLASNDLETTSHQIEEQLAKLDQETKAVGNPLKITSADMKEVGMEELLPTKIAAQWQQIRNSPTSLSQENLERQHSDLTQKISKLINRVGDTSNLILDTDLDSYYLIDVVLALLPQAQQRVGDALLLGQHLASQAQANPEDKFKAQLYASSLLSEDLERIKKELFTSLRENKNFHGVSPSLQKDLPSALSPYEAAVKTFADELVNIAKTDKNQVLSKVFFDRGEEVLRRGTELGNVGIKELDTLLERRIRDFENRRLIYLVLSLGTLAIASFFVYKISREISDRLAKAVEITREVARGNLTTHILVDSHDEIGQLLLAIQVMVYNLNTLIRQTQESGSLVSSSTAELLATSRQQELVTLGQIESTKKVTQTVKGISHIAEDLAQEMDAVASTLDETSEFATKSQSALVQMKEIMQKLEDACDSIYSKLQMIKEKAENITFIITTIVKVTDKSNILSLNAAIEADKAGEHGRGFAVIAKEFRRLSDQTSVAALEIEKVVQETQSAVSTGVAEMDIFIDQVRNGTANVNQVSTQLTNVIQRVQALKPNFEQVNVAMQNQSENAQEISNSIGELGQGMQQIKDSLKENYFAIEHLNEAAIGLQERVSKLKVTT